MSDKHDEQLEVELAVGKWLSAALDDPETCAEMKLDIVNWFTYIESRKPCMEEARVLAVEAVEGSEYLDSLAKKRCIKAINKALTGE